MAKKNDLSKEKRITKEEERLRHISGLIEELVIVKEDLENEISKLLLI